LGNSPLLCRGKRTAWVARIAMLSGFQTIPRIFCRSIMSTSFSKIYQAYKASVLLGWNMDGNWAPPLVYLLIALLAPASGVLILVFMYLVILGDAHQTGFISFVMAGSGVFIFVRLILQGCGWAVVEDREHYRVLRYIYIAPVPFPVQLFGRATSKIGIATVGAALTIIAGFLFLGTPVRTGGIDWLMLLGGFAVGLAGCLALGWILAGVMLLVDRLGWVMVEGVAGMLFLLSGAVIPLSILPGYLADIGELLPITYWAELWRHALYGSSATLSLPDLGIATLWSRLALTTVVSLIVAIIWQRAADRIARRWGRIEVETFY